MHPKQTGLRGFFFKHLTGEYSLARSFWVNSVLIAWCLPIAAMTLQSLYAGVFPPRIACAVYLLLTALNCALLLWAAVGTIRSAKLYLARGGSRFLGKTAPWIVLFLVIDMTSYITRAPLFENLRMALTGRSASPAVITRNGTALLITGSLQNGTATEMMKAIERSPSIKRVTLDSHGGLLDPAIAMAKVVAQYRLSTYVEHECFSACTFVFLAGNSRCISSSAKIGFHTARSLGTPLNTEPPAVANAEREFYAKAGLPAPFIDHIMATPSATMWYPSKAELLDAGVLTPNCPQS
jgi:hypothetical protein